MNIITGHAVVIPLSVWDVNISHVPNNDTDMELYLAQMGFNLGLIGVHPDKVHFFSRSYMRKGDKEGNYLIVIFDNKKDAFNFTMLYNTKLKEN